MIEETCLYYLSNIDTFEKYSYINRNCFRNERFKKIFDRIKNFHKQKTPQLCIEEYVTKKVHKIHFDIEGDGPRLLHIKNTFLSATKLNEEEREAFLNLFISLVKIYMVGDMCCTVLETIQKHDSDTITNDFEKEIITSIEKEIEKIASFGPPESDEKAAEKVVREIKENIEYFKKHKTRADEDKVCKTGIEPIDNMVSLYNGGLWVIGARPGCGKTTLALNVTKNFLESGKRVLFFSLEMPRFQIIRKLITMKLSIPTDCLQSGNLTDSEIERFNQHSDEIREIQCAIVDEANTLNQVRSHIAVLMKQSKYDLIVIDYIQLIHVENNQNRNDQISECSRFFKRSAIKYNIPILMLSQLNRKTDESGEPQLSHLRESGALEQDADAVLLLEDGKKPDQLRVHIPKNRFGSVGSITLGFNKILGQICKKEGVCNK